MDRLLLMAAHCGVGLIPVASGTWGSALGMGLFILVTWLWPPLAWPGLIAVTALGFPASARGEKAWGKDNGRIIIDEIAGQWLTLSLALITCPRQWWVFGLGFILFRLLDITKPWPVSAAEKLPGEAGVMADDLVAGLIAGLAMAVIGLLTG